MSPSSTALFPALNPCHIVSLPPAHTMDDKALANKKQEVDIKAHILEKTLPAERGWLSILPGVKGTSPGTHLNLVGFALFGSLLFWMVHGVFSPHPHFPPLHFPYLANAWSCLAHSRTLASVQTCCALTTARAPCFHRQGRGRMDRATRTTLASYQI